MTPREAAEREALALVPLVGERWPVFAAVGTTLVGLASAMALASRLAAPAPAPVPAPAVVASAAPAVVASAAPPTPPVTAAPAVPPSAPPASAPPVDCVPLFDATFEYGKSAPRFDPEAPRRVAEWMARHPTVTLAIDGHSDALGSTAANLALSHQRATRVGNALAAAGLPRERFTVRAFGAYAPLPGHNHIDARNRRVSFEVIGATACPADAPQR